MKNLIFILFLPVTLTLIVFRKFFVNGTLPIPADILAGGYYPWLDEKWGYAFMFPVKNSLPADIFSIIYPWRFQGIELLKSGHLPLWDPTILLGVPLFANFQAALLNPFNLLFILMPFNLAWAWQVVLQPILLFITSYIYLRNIKVSKYASIIGGIFFSFSGYSMVWMEYNSIVYTLIYFPLVLYFIDKLCVKPKVIYAFLIGIALALQVFSGYPLNAFYTIGAGILYFSYRCYLNRATIPFKVFILTLGILTGLFVSAIQLIPGQEAASLSIRGFDNSAQAADIKYLPIKHLINFFIPDFYGNPGTQNYSSLGSYDNFAFFITVVGIFLFLLSLTTRVAFKRENFIFIILCVGSLVYALQNPISEYFGNMQIIGLDAAVNTRILFIFVFGASVLAAFTLDAILKTKATLFQALVPLVVFFSLLIAVGLSYRQTQELERNIANILAGEKTSDMAWFVSAQELQVEINTIKSVYIIAIRNTIIPVLVSFLAFIIFVVGNKKLIYLSVPILVLSSVFTFDKYLSFTHSNAVFPQLQSIEVLKKLSGLHRFEREKAELYPGNSWSVYGLNSPSGQNAVAPLSTVRYLELINRGEINDKILTRFINVTNTKSPLFNTLDVEIFAYLDRHVKESIPFKEGRPFPWIIPEKFKEVADTGTVRLYKNTQNLGSSWFTPNIICEKDIEKVAGILKLESFNSREKTVVECGDGVVLGGVGTSEIISSTPNSISFKTKNDTDNYLIISKANYPGWVAMVDSNITPIKTANMALMAVYVPKGEHIVSLKYSPDSVKLGVKISFVALLAWLTYFSFRYLHLVKKIVFYKKSRKPRE